MNILALDTSTEHGSAALSNGEETVWQRHMHSLDGFSHVLFKELQELSSQVIHLGMVDVFAAASGPGSFTGVRVALATVKALAEALGKGAIGVSCLQALACYGTKPLRAVMIDARRNECYAAVYDSHLRLLSAEIVGDPKSWLRSLPEEDYEFVSQNSVWLTSLLAAASRPSAHIVEAPLHIAPAVARCAALRIAEGWSPDPVALDANYVRRSDVNLYWHDR